MNKKRILFNKLEKQNMIIRILNNQSIVKQKGKRKGKKSSITIIRNTCLLTGRNRGLIKDYKISRIKLKEYYRDNNISGLRKRT